MPVRVSLEEPSSEGVEIRGGGYVAALAGTFPDALVSPREIEEVVDWDAESLDDRLHVPEIWRGPYVSYFHAVPRRPGAGLWLLEPAIVTSFDFGPFYRMWESGASLWLTVDGFVVVVRGAELGRVSAYSETATIGQASVPDSDWLSVNDKQGGRVLEVIEGARSRGGIRVELQGFEIDSLPPSFAERADWRDVHISGSPGLDIRNSLGELQSLETLLVTSSGPLSVGSDWPSSLRSLALKDNQLVLWPEGLSDLAALERLSLDKNELAALAYDIGEMKNLQRLSLAGNNLIEVPYELGQLGALRFLHVQNNSIETVDPAIGCLENLETLDLSGNKRLSSLPTELLELPDGCAIRLHGTSLPNVMVRARTIGDLRRVWSG